MKNNSLGTKLFMAAITLALLLYFGFQAVNYFSDPLSTTLAYAYQVEETAALTGYVVREELVIPDETGGLLQLQREEGERVAVGGTVAKAYANRESLERQQEIEALDRRIEQLRYVQEAEAGVEVARKLDQQIRQNVLDYRASVAAGRLNDAEKSSAELRAQVLKYDYTITDTEDVDARLQELQAERKALQAQSGGSVQRITAPESGLYSAVVDGYETVLRPEGLKDLMPSDLTALRADSEVRSGVGKLILGKEWYFVAAVPEATAAQLEKLETRGTELTLRFAKGVERDLSVTIDSVSEAENGRCVVVFRGDTYLAQLTLLRQQSARIIYDVVEGVRVPKEALRVLTKTVEQENGTVKEVTSTGVYTIMGLEARFKPVEVVYTGETYVLVRSTARSDQENLRLRPGDEIIIAANDLSDGKVVR